MTKKLSLGVIVLGTLLASSCVVLSPAVVPGTLLLQARITESQPEGTVVVAGGPAAYRALHFEVEGNPVVIYRVVVTYRTGEREDLPVNWVVARGRWTRALDLREHDRAIQNVTLYYRPAQERGGGEKDRLGAATEVATVRVFGVQ